MPGKTRSCCSGVTRTTPLQTPMCTGAVTCKRRPACCQHICSSAHLMQSIWCPGSPSLQLTLGVPHRPGRPDSLWHSGIPCAGSPEKRQHRLRPLFTLFLARARVLIPPRPPCSGWYTNLGPRLGVENDIRLCRQLLQALPARLLYLNTDPGARHPVPDELDAMQRRLRNSPLFPCLLC